MTGDVDDVDELAGARAWLADAQRRVDEGVAKYRQQVADAAAGLARRYAERDEAERALRDAQAHLR